MKVTDQQRQLLNLCAIRLDDHSLDWSLLAREAVKSGGLDRLTEGKVVETSAAADKAREMLKTANRQTEYLDQAAKRVSEELNAAETVGARLVTVLDDDYPTNLRLIYNLPPFLFIRGTGPDERDVRSVCVVGTRKASQEGLDKAALMAKMLTNEKVTVISGLAAGIDTAAHKATLDAGGRTIAVIGTGITSTYPRENEKLADVIAEHGAVVSQFWPTANPARWTFPRRNVVMSGIAQGTVVIEASSTSGAKMQARLALEHGKKVFLISSLVEQQPWAAKYLERGAISVDRVKNVIEHLAPADKVIAAAEQRRQVAIQMTLEMA